jgi:hypothetical protein
LVADTKKELEEIRRLLRAAGFKPGKPFTKSNQWRQPVYGRTELVRFLKMVRNANRPAKPKRPKITVKRATAKRPQRRS